MGVQIRCTCQVSRARLFASVIDITLCKEDCQLGS